MHTNSKNTPVVFWQITRLWKQNTRKKDPVFFLFWNSFRHENKVKYKMHNKIEYNKNKFYLMADGIK